MTLAASSTASSPIVANYMRSETLSPGLGIINILSAAPFVAAADGASSLPGRRKAVHQSGRVHYVAAQTTTLKLTSD